jgi:hypothetical protein
VLDGAGTGTVRLGPVPFPQSWRLTSVSVRSTSTLRTRCTVYRNSATDANRLDVTESSGNADTTDTVIELLTAESLVIVWENGTPGAAVSATGDGYRTDQLGA